jgi:hypothetical protein
MPWSVERDDNVVHVDIEHPIQGWDELIKEIQANLDPFPDALTLPRDLPGAYEIDWQLLRMLWATLSAQPSGDAAGRLEAGSSRPTFAGTCVKVIGTSVPAEDCSVGSGSPMRRVDLREIPGGLEASPARTSDVRDRDEGSSRLDHVPVISGSTGTKA